MSYFVIAVVFLASGLFLGYLIWGRKKQIQISRSVNPDLTFTVISDGASSDLEIQSMQNDGCEVYSWARDVMGQSSYKEGIPLAGKSYHLEIILGSEFSDKKRTIENIRALAKSRGLIDMPAGLTNKAVNANPNKKVNKLGLFWLLFMTTLITDSEGFPSLLGLYCRGVDRRLNGCYGRPGHKWRRRIGFVFLRP